MKKLNLNLLLAAILVFTVAAWAQGGGGSGGGGAAGGGQGGGSGAASGGHGAQGGGAGGSAAGASTSGSAAGGASMGNGAGAKGENRTLEGCVIQQGSDFFLQPTKGKKAMVRLVPQNGQDLSAHVGHTVKVHGTSQIAYNPNAPAAGKDTNITERDMASAAQGTNVPNSLTTPDQNPPKANDALAGSGALPQGSEVNAANGDFTVTKIDMVSDTCKMKGGKHDKGMENNGTNPPSNPPL
jgi:hypothetical protein